MRRADLLIEQRRYDMAADELRQALGHDPDNPIPHAMLGICLAESDAYEEAAAECRRAVHLGPDIAFCHYALATVLNKLDLFRDAETAAREAVALAPGDPHHYAVLSMILLNRKQWPAALEAAETGLELDGESVDCLNFRAVALTKLGRRAEAGEAIDIALKRAPEDAHSHANMGWTLLHEGQARPAMNHFREALRLEPNMEWARLGIIEAMKARNLLYRLLLRHALWMSSLSAATQWGLMIGLIVALQIIARLDTDSFALQVVFNVILLGWIVFVMLVWMQHSLFNLMLMCSRFGRLALSREQKIDALIIGGAVVVAGTLAGATYVQHGPAALWTAISYLLTLLAVAVAVNAPRGKNRGVLLAASAVIVAAAVGHWIMQDHYHGQVLTPAENRSVDAKLDALSTVYLWGSIAMTWVGSSLNTRWRP